MSQNLWKGKQDKHPLKTSRSGRTLNRSQKVITSSDDGSSLKKSKTTTEVDEKMANLKEKYATIIANRSSKSPLQILKSIKTLSSGITLLYNKSKDDKSKPDCSLASGSQSLQIDGHTPTSFLSPYTLGSPLDFKSNKNDSTNSRSDNLNKTLENTGPLDKSKSEKSSTSKQQNSENGHYPPLSLQDMSANERSDPGSDDLTLESTR
ncbi:uncharacterized protein LOC127289289 [Leptopilina boulardi]|uniref:uncharacterized protein LOC127289289 n=1 Tax=Leptopilina boulardi TaxID=63433 RepID=UPI0021F5ECE4|nr:uncharacterized protein LOC127289289 [Leptopilina boulardi]